MITLDCKYRYDKLYYLIELEIVKGEHFSYALNDVNSYRSKSKSNSIISLTRQSVADAVVEVLSVDLNA